MSKNKENVIKKWIKKYKKKKWEKKRKNVEKKRKKLIITKVSGERNGAFYIISSGNILCKEIFYK